MKRLYLALILTILLSAAPARAQGGFVHDADVWCIQHHPCDWSSHAAGTVAGALLLDAITPLKASETRWIIVAYYVQREVRQIIHWKEPGGLDASKVVPLPRWLDSMFDMGFMAFGTWLAPRIDFPDLWPDSRAKLVVGPRSIGVMLGVP